MKRIIYAAAAAILFLLSCTNTGNKENDITLTAYLYPRNDADIYQLEFVCYHGSDESVSFRYFSEFYDEMTEVAEIVPFAIPDDHINHYDKGPGWSATAEGHVIRVKENETDRFKEFIDSYTFRLYVKDGDQHWYDLWLDDVQLIIESDEIS